MRDRIIMIAALLFIAACALITFDRINSAYSPPDAPAPLVYTPSPAGLPVSATATTPASPARPRPRHTVTTWVTVTAHPAASTGGEDGP